MMRVNPNNEPSNLTAIAGRSVDRARQLGSDRLVLTSADSLNCAVAASPAIRPGKVQHAQSLLNDTSYPPDVIIQGIAKLLATHLASPSPSPVPPPSESEAGDENAGDPQDSESQ